MKAESRTIVSLTILVAVVAVGLVSTTTTHAGILNPAPVARTGQTMAYVAGDDGDLQEGVAWPEPRFVDNLDGTVTDQLTGLVWLKAPIRFTLLGWVDALNACSTLAADGVQLNDGSVAGDWRLPNIKELRRLIDFGTSTPALPAGHPFIVPVRGDFWSSTTATNNINRAWKVSILDGRMVNDPKNAPNLVWPVRDGAGGPGPAPVPKTGRVMSFGPRDDGALQKGVEWPEPRFIDNLDGTVTDSLTGLLWLKDSTRFTGLTWSDAVATSNALADDGDTLTDGSVPGEWRMPNVWELGSLSDFSQIGPALPPGNPFIGGGAGTFWTSTTAAADGDSAWTIGMGIGRILSGPKDTPSELWPVRGAMRVAVDVKPGGCPNPVNLTSRGVLPVSILGSADFDVRTIDPVSIRLEGVAPIRSSLKDVAAPYEPLVGKQDCKLDCTSEGPDGWTDLNLKFRTQEIVEAFGETSYGECRVVTLTGNLREEAGSTPIEGEDVIMILGSRQRAPMYPAQRTRERGMDSTTSGPVGIKREVD